MNEREIVAGLLSGRITLTDTRGITVDHFEDPTMRRIYFAVETLIANGYMTTTPRILVGFDACGWPIDGVAELVDRMRVEG